jgi:hypothetical protein
MPFDPSYQYGVKTQEITHLSVPPKGRKVVSADFVAMYIGNIAIGLIQQFAPREAREVLPQYEIGDIYPVEFVPSTWSGQIDVRRLEIFKDSLFDAFQYNQALLPGVDTYDLYNYWPADKFGPVQGATVNGTGSGTRGAVITTIADIQWPINIAVHTMNPAPEVNGITVKTYLECWITGYQTAFDAGAKTVMESVSFTYRNTQINQASIANLNSFVVGATTGDSQSLVTAPTSLTQTVIQ